MVYESAKSIGASPCTISRNKAIINFQILISTVTNMKKRLVGLFLLLLITCTGTFLMINMRSEIVMVPVDPKIIQSVEGARIDSVTTQRIMIAKVVDERIVVTDKGTLILLQKDAFKDSTGNPVNEHIELQIKELCTVNDLVKTRVSTRAGEQLLSTAGSYYIDASSNGQPLQINPQVGLYVSFPYVEEDEAMALFQGKILPSGDIDWILKTREEAPVPKPTIQEPAAFKEVKGIEEVRSAERFLQRIDQYYVKQGDKYVSKADRGHDSWWNADYVRDVKKWYANYQYKEALSLKRREAYRQAWNNYFNHPEVKAYKAYGKRKRKELTSYQNRYEYKLDQLGWYNVDKFVKETLVVYEGTILNPSGKPADWVRVHLISHQESIHITDVVEEGGKFSFRFPAGKPFEIYATRRGQHKRADFEGSDVHLGEIQLEEDTLVSLQGF